MYKKILSLTCLLLFTAVAHSQNFGDQFKNWVLSEAATDSRTLAKADYEDRVAHTITTINQLLIRQLRLADSLMHAAYTQIEQDEKALTGSDSLQSALLRARSARQAHYRLLEAENHLYFASKLKNSLDSLGSFTVFYGTGLYHVGRETLLESYATIGQQFADNFQLKYQNDFYIGARVNFNENGDLTGGSGEAGQPGLFTFMGSTVGAAIGSPTIVGAAVGAVVGGAIGNVIDNFLGSKKAKEEQEKAEKKFKKQMKLLKEGLDSLPGQLAPVDTLLQYYQGYVSAFSTANAGVYQYMDSTLNLEQQRFKEIFAYNVRRMKLSQQQLTSERIAIIERNFMATEGLRNFYSNLGRVNFLSDCNAMISRLATEENWLRSAQVNRFGWLQRREAYEDDLRFAQLLIHQFLSDESYLPYQRFLLQQKAALEKMADNVPVFQERTPLVAAEALYPGTHLVANTGKRQIQDRKASGFPVNQQVFKVTSASPDAFRIADNQHLLVMPQSVLAAAARTDSYDFGICFGAGGYSLCRGMNEDSYGNRFNNGGQSPVTDILGSSYDGGLQSFSATATRKIENMRTDIRERVQNLKKDYADLSTILPEARKSYTRQALTLATSAGQLGTISTPQIRSFEQAFSNSMPEVQQRLNQFMNQPFRTGLASLQRDLDLQQQIKDHIKPADIPTRTFRIGNVDFGYTATPGSSPVALAWNREAGKQLRTLEAIDHRVADNSDPVFRNRKEFDDFKAKLVQVDRLLENVSNNRHYDYDRRQQIAAHYLAEAVKMRYAASGQLPPSDLSPADYPFVDNDQLGRLNSIVNDFKNCDAGYEDCTSAYGHAIYQLYQHNGVVGLRNDEGQSFNAANLQQLAISSSDWEAVGPASSTTAVNQATLLAMSGNPVIATWQDGMNIRTGIVLPELPTSAPGDPWKGLPSPAMLYLDEDKPEHSIPRTRLSSVFPVPGEVQFYTSRRPQSFSGVPISIQDQGVKPFAYSDPILGDKGTVPAVRFNVQTHDGSGSQPVSQTIPIAGDYINRIVLQYGNNSRQVLENLYEHRDDIYGSYPVTPAGLSPAENDRLRDLHRLTDRFEGKNNLLNNPQDFYYCQTSRCLYNSCVNELSNAAPADRSKILDYYNQVEAALIKYRDDALNIGTMFTPGINDARDLYEFLTGKDLITGALLTIWERGLSGAGLLIGSGAFYRHIDNLPMFRKEALDIAHYGVPDFKLVQSGNTQYFESAGGIKFERMSTDLQNDRFKKIVNDHYLNANKSRFDVDNPNKIPGLLDEAWKRAKELEIKPVPGTNKDYDNYIVPMGRKVGQKGEQYIYLLFDRTKESGFIVTAYPSFK